MSRGVSGWVRWAPGQWGGCLARVWRSAGLCQGDWRRAWLWQVAQVALRSVGALRWVH
jgi:hypothetical protein